MATTAITPADELVPPENKGPSPRFSILCTNLFDRLLDITKARKTNIHAKVYELRAGLLRDFIDRWRFHVGNDIYPLFRLLMPEKDSERPAYGMKEKRIADFIMEMQNIDPSSDDGKSLLNWKVGFRQSSGDFPERCYEVLKKRETRVSSNLTVDEVNSLLDKLSMETDNQKEIMTTMFQSMDAEEIRWLIKIILRDMHYGLTEKSILAIWHPDALTLFSVTSNLKRVCWELYVPDARLSLSKQAIALMSCFQPQLASYRKSSSFQEIVRRMPSSFYLEEKMDGERIQLHMDDYGKEFKFFSRKATDYTRLYGSSLDSQKGSLTKHLKGVFDPKVKSCILDGEMVAWSFESETVIPFGALKTAVLNEINGKKTTHPMFLVFDILFLNGVPLVKYKLSERKKVLSSIITEAKSRLEVLPFVEAKTELELTTTLERVIETASEGLVIKNPNSPYRVSERHHDWIKHKPEYLNEFGENLEVCIIGGYFGNGKLRGTLGSFLCGVRVEEEGKQKFWSFCKVGGGISALDYRNIEHLTQGKWHKWDKLNPPTEYMVLAGKYQQREAPDQWIKPEDSIIIQIKGSQVIISESFQTLKTLRFPRFTRIRNDKDYKTCLSYEEFIRLQREVDLKISEKIQRHQIVRPAAGRSKKVKIIQHIPDKFEGPTKSDLFDGHTFFILSDQIRPRVSRSELEMLVQENGGHIITDYMPSDNLHVIADKVLVKVAGIIGSGTKQTILRPNWLLTCIRHNRIIRVEPKHILHSDSSYLREAKRNVDRFGDSYYEDVGAVELKDVSVIDSKKREKVNSN